MIYTAGTVGSINPVRAMFGLVRRKDVMDAIELAREDACAARVENFEKDQEKFVAFIRDANRPKEKKKAKPDSTEDLAP